MADSNVAITAGSGTLVDTRTNTSGEHREVVVLGADGDPVATLTTVGSDVGLDVNITGSGGGVADVTGTVTNASNQSVQAAVGLSGNATISITGGTWSGMPIIFEASADGGTNWFGIDATQADGTGINTTITLPASGGPRNWNITCPGYTHVRVRTTGTFTSFTTSPTILIRQGPFLWDPSPTVAPIDGQKLSYSLTINSGATAGIANALDQLVFGNPTGTGKTVRVTYISFQVSLATAAAGQVQLVKRSSANTGGTQVTATRIPYDSADATSVATGGGAYSAAPTGSGTLVGIIRQWRGTLAVSPGVAFEWTFGNRPSKAIVLRPGEYIGLQVLSATGTAAATAPTVTGFIEWTEE